jgi:hypothetical protein
MENWNEGVSMKVIIAGEEEEEEGRSRRQRCWVYGEVPDDGEYVCDVGSERSKAVAGFGLMVVW